jgi:conserved oligomeric Golgi complex subunit 3
LSTATVAKRAKSYSDFYDIVRGQMKEELRDHKQKRRQRNKHLANEVEFESWYSGLENELLDASHDEYRYVNYSISQNLV